MIDLSFLATEGYRCDWPDCHSPFNPGEPEKREVLLVEAGDVGVWFNEDGDQVWVSLDAIPKHTETAEIAACCGTITDEVERLTLAEWIEDWS